MKSNGVNNQRFWYLLERKASGNATGSELAELDKMVMLSPEAGNTAVLIGRLWQCRSADEIERVIRQEMAEGHDGHYLWPEECPKTIQAEQPLSVFDKLIAARNSQAFNSRKIGFLGRIYYALNKSFSKSPTAMIRNNLRIVWRNLANNKVYGALNIAGLAIGIACAGLIFLWVADEVSYDNLNVKKDRLYNVMVNADYGGNKYIVGSTPRLLASSIKVEIPGIANTCRVSDADINSLFTVNGNAVYANGRYADPSIFRMFTFSFIEGNQGNPYSQLYSIVIPEKTAKKFFGNERNVVGKTIRMDNAQDYVVSGVVEDMPGNSSLQFEWLAPYQALMQQNFKQYGNYDEDWNSYGPFTYVELAPSANPAVINQKLFNYLHGKDATTKNITFLYPMSHWHLYNEFANGQETGGGRIKQVRLLSVIAWVILLIACINFMNLATARSEKRAKEIGVRKVLGSGRGRLILQFISESLVMSVMAAILAVVIMIVVLPAFNTLVQKELSLGLGNPVHLAALLCITLICGLLAGSYPSLYLSSFDPVKVLKGLKIKSGSAALVRKGLVVLQFAISVIFIISTIIIYMQIQHVKDRNLGFNKNNLVEIDMHDIKNNFLVIKQAILSTGLVQNVALSDYITIYGGNSDNAFKWEGKQSDNQVGISFRSVSPEFISTSGMKVVDGRDFSGAPSDTSTVIVTRSLANIINKNGVVGTIIQSPRGMKTGMYRNLRIVGVVDDYVFGNVYDQAAAPVIFLCRSSSGQYGADILYVRIRDGQISQRTLATIGAVIKKYNPAYPFQYEFVDEQFNGMFANEVQMSKLSAIFATLAIIISCLGLFSLAAYTAERRIKEIGIRKVLGASVSGLAGLLSKDFFQLVGVSCLVAFPVAWYIMHNWLQNYAYRISISWWIFAISGAVALLIALLTVSYQAVRAALANPVQSLRAE